LFCGDFILHHIFLRLLALIVTTTLSEGSPHEYTTQILWIMAESSALEIAESRRLFRALETITATRCAHETTPLLNNSTSNRVLKFIHPSLDAGFMQLGFRQVWLFHSKGSSTLITILQYLYLLTSAEKILSRYQGQIHLLHCHPS
jgi:hypothetical protein